MTREEAENLDLINCTDAEYEEWLLIWRPIFEKEWEEFNNNFLSNIFRG